MAAGVTEIVEIGNTQTLPLYSDWFAKSELTMLSRVFQ